MSKSMLLVYGILMHSTITLGAETPANCAMSATTGCLNGNSYNFLDKKVCGKSLYDKKTVVNPKSVGTCAKWTAAMEAAAPECWDCSGRRLDMETYESLAEAPLEEQELEKEPEPEQVPVEAAELEEEGEATVDAAEPSLRRRLGTWPSPFPLDTVASGASPTPCTTIDDTYGCFNTYKFFYNTDYICDKYLLKNNAYGCCDGIPYRFASQSCCFLDDVYVVKNADHWCACASKECVPTLSPTEPAAPTGVPIFRPTSEPTMTYKPTFEETEPPTSSPTVSHRPTLQVVTASSGLEDEPFKVNYLYGAAAFVAVGVGVVCYLQNRASSLIKERHEVALEIADTNFN